ncbi:hypothetical protein L6452_11482 [Arctium lappa]|uniref:Uncharacterized protein n=1 Tax=Arctium lappa TaxID=4217 RepID=A0ACB9DPF8_ARCLA|nr:hypothetical protein L6452_11482 [Arctium lappa]
MLSRLSCFVLRQGFRSFCKRYPCVPAFHQNMFSSTDIQPSMELKLQLFPVDESIIRKALEVVWLVCECLMYHSKNL